MVPAMSHALDLAMSALGKMSEVWQLDKERVRWFPQSTRNLAGFDWWPGDFHVRVWADASREDQESDQIRLCVRTDFLKEVAANDGKFSSLAALLSRHMTSTYAWVYAPPSLDAPSITPNPPLMWFSSTAYISPDHNGWLPEFFARATVMQPINAQIQAKGMMNMLGTGTPHITRPEHLRDKGLDEILEVAAQIFVPIGQEPSRWADSSEFETFAEKWAKSDYCFGFADRLGLSFETPFGKDTALARLFTTEKHPQLGNGLLATLQLPISGDGATMAKQVAELNFLEAISWTNFPQLGCWHTNQNRGTEEGLAFSLFVPNALYVPGSATRIAVWLFQRARWVREQMYPQMVDLTMLEILNSRASMQR